MSYETIFKRYEVKYLLTAEQYQKLQEIMVDDMIPDKFGKSVISNIYFDTPSKLLIRRSLEKPVYKEKLRVRSYGVATEDTQVFLELKKKYQGVVYKRRMDLSEQMAMDYLCRNIPLEKPTQISKEIDYFMRLYERVEPSMVLSYHREAFFSQHDHNFRMTFDENILYRDYDLSLTKGVYGNPILPPERVLLEVKTALGMPRWLLDFFSENKIYKISFSKYGNAYQLEQSTEKVGGRIDVA